MIWVRALVPFALGALTLVAIAACGDDDGGGVRLPLGGEETATVPSSTGDTGATDEEGRGPAAGGDATNAAPPADARTVSAQEWLDAWRPLSDRESQARYQVEYRTILDGEEHSMVVYRDGARDAERVEAETVLGGRIVWVREGETRYSCDPEERSCRRVATEGALAGFTVPGIMDQGFVRLAFAAVSLAQLGEEGEEIAEDAGGDAAEIPVEEYEFLLGTREYLGETLQCFGLRDKGDGTYVELCYTNDGIPAYWTGGEGVTEPVRIERDFDDSVFEPPYEVTE